MAQVRWIKLTTTMFDDEKIRIIESMPDADSILIIWIKLMTLAGKVNHNGYIFLTKSIPYTDEMLSGLFNRPLNTVRLALQVFSNFGMIEYDEYDFLHLTNWEKHQNIEGLERIREQTRERVAKHREKQRSLPNNQCNVTGNANVTPGNATELDIELEEDIDTKSIIAHQKCAEEKTKARKPFSSIHQQEVFELWWSRYPKKKSKGNAEKAWAKINPSAELSEKILFALAAAVKSYDWTKEEGEYIPYPASWLNAKGWEDEYTEAKAGKGKGQADDEPREVWIHPDMRGVE